MEIDVIRQLEKQMEVFGIQVVFIEPPYRYSKEVDRGLRGTLFKDLNFVGSVSVMKTFFEEQTLYLIKDAFEVHYALFWHPGKERTEEGPKLIQIGPWILDNPEDMIDMVLDKNRLPLHFRKELKEYYYGLPLIHSKEILEGLIINQAGYIFGGKEAVKVSRLEDIYEEQVKTGQFATETEDDLSMSMIEERYRCEEQMMEAIRKGDMEKVIETSNRFQGHRIERRSEDTLRNGKNMMIVWNVLFRKAVQEADVHPAHIDRVSAMFAKQIEASTSGNELEKVAHAMIRKYCLLVRNHSLKGYSPVIRAALNCIDFNLKEPLSLKYLAEKGNVNASYLSNHFKLETGKTVTEYINEKRIQSSLVFLATTDLPIHKVAELVGIYDENYFSRLFKKYRNQTPKQYRNMMQAKM